MSENELKVVSVRVIALEGYVPGVVTTLNSLTAERLVKEKRVVILEEQKVSDKKAPAVNSKEGKK